MTADITVQLFSVRNEASENYEKTIRAIAAMGFENVEPAGYPGSSVAEASKLFKELGLKAPSCHGALPIGEDKNQIIEDALAMGHKYIFTGCPPHFSEDFKSHDSIKALAELYCEAGEVAAKHGIQVGYHNHDWDLIEIDGKQGYKTFLENTPETVLWEADLFWVSRAGLNTADFVTEIGARGKVLHFKDGDSKADGTFREAETEDGKIMLSDSSPFLPAGSGDVDLTTASAAAKHVELVAVELDTYTGDMMKAVQESYTYLTKAGFAKGRI